MPLEPLTLKHLVLDFKYGNSQLFPRPAALHWSHFPRRQNYSLWLVQVGIAASRVSAVADRCEFYFGPGETDTAATAEDYLLWSDELFPGLVKRSGRTDTRVAAGRFQTCPFKLRCALLSRHHFLPERELVPLRIILFVNDGVAFVAGVHLYFNGFWRW